MTDPHKHVSVLLASAAYGGTLATVRHLGISGLDVRVLSSQRLSAAAWSRHLTKSHTAPTEGDSDRFLQLLLSVGAAHPGQILLPSSDETAWLYTVNAEVLEKHFRMYQPSIRSMQRILDKKLFSDAAVAAGVAVLPNWEPRDVEEVVALAPRLPYPILIKPRTHVNRFRNDKGVVVSTQAELLQQYPLFLAREKEKASKNPLMPDARLPILQQFVRSASEGVCSVSGFIDKTGELFVTRRSTKIFQRAQPVGTGICFESLPTDLDLATAVRRLCLELKYFGLFEVEFLRFGEQWAVIDFNPRLFNQIGMDIKRGMPLPLLACLDAAGDTSGLKVAVAKAQVDECPATVFCDGFTFRAILAARRLTGRITAKESAYWRSWATRNAPFCIDVASDTSDPLPGVVHALSELYLGLRAFPRFLRLTPRTLPVDAAAEMKAES